MSNTKHLKEWVRFFPKDDLQYITQYLDKQYQTKSILPLKTNVFRVFNECSYNKLSVVILGEDPYSQKGIATGIAFANEGENKTSPSLLQIQYALELEDKDFDKSLIKWCNQGVLLLNTALTVEENNTGSHILLWRPFIKKFLRNLQEYNPGMIYVLLGKNAQSFECYINPKFNYIIKDKHPAYYARTHTTMSSYVFDRVNEILYNNNGYKINW